LKPANIPPSKKRHGTQDVEDAAPKKRFKTASYHGLDTNTHGKRIGEEKGEIEVAGKNAVTEEVNITTMIEAVERSTNLAVAPQPEQISGAAEEALLNVRKSRYGR
jgi:hypothetical protein